MSKKPLPLIASSASAGCVGRRAILSSVSLAALAACSGSVSGGDGGPDADSDAGADDSGSTDSGGGCTGTNAGAVSSYPQGTWKKVGAFIIGHDANGLFAFSTVCTHNGCSIGAPSATGATQCPCHGARFDGNGNVTAGPASSPLPHFALSVCNGQVFVNTNTTVSASTRTPA